MAPLSESNTYNHNKQDAESFEEIEILQNHVQSPKEKDTSPPEAPANRQVVRSTGTSKSCCTRSLLIRVGIVVVVLIAVTIALMFGLAPPGGPKQWFARSHPPGLSEAQRWDNGGYGGLSLTVVNALDDNYQSLFYEWVEKWANGTPDALSLSTEQVSYDFECTPEDGVLKVCNGNYGDTGWRGIDLSTTFDGFIVNSVAKMNDFFLTGEGESWKSYTMCHEMGHGWGLPHTDENSYNFNRGDCLDMTLNVNGNVEPGSYNYNLLAQLYGTVDGKVNATMLTNATKSGTNSFDRSRHLRHSAPERGFRRLDAAPPSHRALVEARYLSAVKAFDEGNLCHKLTGSKTGCTIDLGHGYRLGAHIFPVDI